MEEFSGFNPEAVLEESHAFGDTYAESLYSGFNRIGAITLSGKLDDDSSTGTVGLFGQSSDLGAERALRLNFAGTTGVSTGAPTNLKVDFLVQSYKRLPQRGGLTRFELVVQPTGGFSAVTTT